MIALLIMIMHDILIHFYFLKASITFHSSNYPTPSHKIRFLADCTGDSVSYPFSPHPTPRWHPLLTALS